MNPKDTYFSVNHTLNCRGSLLDLSVPVVMGIINITPDSFYKGSRTLLADEAVKRAEKHLEEGAAILDIGAFSSRPGATFISEEEEKKRLDPVLNAIRKKYPSALISIDTFRSSIASWAHKEYRINMINDISAGEMDTHMFDTMASLQIPYIIMHMQGQPENMQVNPHYENIIAELLLFFSQKIHALRRAGVKDIVIDPGFGFGKTLEHNYQLVRYLELFRMTGCPVMAGFSRKSMIYRLLGTSPEEALNGTTVLNTIALLKGISILRVHDVKEAVEAIKIISCMKTS